MGGAAAALVVAATGWLVKPELEARALADAPIVEARVQDARVGQVARYSRPSITYVLPSGVEGHESFNFAPDVSSGEVTRLRPGDRIPVHVDPGGGSASELHVRSAQWFSWILLIGPAIIVLVLLLMLPALLELIAALGRIRRWPAVLAEVRVSRRDGRALRVEAHYDLSGAVRAEMPVSGEEWERWAKLAQAPPDGEAATLPVLVDPGQPDRS